MLLEVSSSGEIFLEKNSDTLSRIATDGLSAVAVSRQGLPKAAAGWSLLPRYVFAGAAIRVRESRRDMGTGDARQVPRGGQQQLYC